MLHTLLTTSTVHSENMLSIALQMNNLKQLKMYKNLYTIYTCVVQSIVLCRTKHGYGSLVSLTLLQNADASEAHSLIDPVQRQVAQGLPSISSWSGSRAMRCRCLGSNADLAAKMAALVLLRVTSMRRAMVSWAVFPGAVVEAPAGCL